MTILAITLAFSNFDRHIFDDDSKIILSLTMQVKHSINLILVPPIIDKVNDRCANHDHIEDIHDIIVITVIGFRKFDWRESDKP